MEMLTGVICIVIAFLVGLLVGSRQKKKIIMLKEGSMIYNNQEYQGFEIKGNGKIQFYRVEK